MNKFFKLKTMSRLDIARLNFLLIVFIFCILTLILYRRLSPAGDIFNQILILSGLNFIAVLLIVRIFGSPFKSWYEVYVSLTCSLVVFAFITSFFLLNIDRSRSFYVLEWTKKELILLREGQLDLNKIHSSEALNKVAIEQRIEEQINRGLMKRGPDRTYLTGTGIFLVKFSDYLSKLFVLRGWQENGS